MAKRIDFMPSLTVSIMWNYDKDPTKKEIELMFKKLNAFLVDLVNSQLKPEYILPKDKVSGKEN